MMLIQFLSLPITSGLRACSSGRTRRQEQVDFGSERRGRFLNFLTGFTIAPRAKTDSFQKGVKNA
jgi:hypothetical protein